MKYSFLGFAIIMAGLFGVVFLMLLQNMTINNESEYYVLKEAMEASMLEAVDLDCYRNAEQEGCGGVVKISEQKFVENFTRRFAASVNGNVEEYEIQFYDIIESPPKASVAIKGLTGEYEILSTDVTEANFEIVNSLSGILEHKLVNEDNDELSVGDSLTSIPDPKIEVEKDNKKSNNKIETEGYCDNRDPNCAD